MRSGALEYSAVNKCGFSAYHNFGGEFMKGNSCGQTLNLAAVSAANAIAEGLSDDEINLLAALLQLVGEALAVIPAARGFCGGKGTGENVFIK